MSTRRTLIRAQTGVRLVRIEQLDARQRLVQRHFRLSTLRPQKPRIYSDYDEALDAFDLEVIATLADPVISMAADRAEEQANRG